MTDEVVRPQDILTGSVMDDLVDAVMDAFMAKGAVASGAIVGLKFHELEDHGGKRRYKYEYSIAGNNPTVYCESDDWQWQQHKAFRGDSDLGDGVEHVDVGENAYQVTLFDPAAKKEELRAELASWLDPWVRDCPSPNVHLNQIDSMATIAAQLYVGDSPTQGVGGRGPVGADTDLGNALAEVDINIDGDSLAVDAFERAYSKDVAKTVGGQQAMAYAAGLALTAEASAWNEAYRALRTIIVQATSDFESWARETKGHGQTLDGVLTATSTVVGVLGLVGGKISSPFGAAMSAVGTGVGLVQKLNPPLTPRADESVALTGESFEARMESFTGIITKIHQDLAAAEQVVADSCRNMVADMRDNPDNYSLTRGGRRGEQPGEDFGGVLRTRLAIDWQKLTRTAAACKVIGDHQIGLGKIVGGNDAVGNPSGYVANEWTRGYLPGVGSIGLDYTGPREDFRVLLDALQRLLIEEGKNSLRVSEAVYDMVDDFQATDDEQRRLFDRTAAELDHEDLRRGNEPA